MEEAKVIIDYKTFKKLEEQYKELLNLLLKLMEETDIDEVKNKIIDFNTTTKSLWL